MDPITVSMGLAQFAPSIIKFFTGSDKDAERAQRIVDVAQTITGTGSGPEALEKIRASQELQLKLRQQIVDQENLITSGQIELNKLDAQSTSLFRSGWRPAVGWICVFALAYHMLFRPVIGWYLHEVIKWPFPPPLEIDTLLTLLFGLLGLGAYRTVEKVKGLS